MSLNKDILEKCRGKLLDVREHLLNQIHEARASFHAQEDRGGDEADQTLRAMAESEFLSRTERIRFQLAEIDSALARLENGTYGICEETEEQIEVERLLAIPWTRLSIEGAEIRESQKRHRLAK